MADCADFERELPRGFGLSTATYVVIASMVGVGILTTSGFTIKDTGSHTLMLGLWLIGGLLAMCGALTVAELAAAMPKAGGEYVFVREAYGRPMAFLYGWISFLIGFAAPTALAAHSAGRYLIAPWVDVNHPSVLIITRALAALFIILMTVAHLRGQAVGSGIQDISTVVKLAALLAIVVGGLALRRGDLGHFAPDLPQRGTPWSVLAISLVYIMFSYSGWNAASYIAGEVRDPHRTLPRSLLIGCGAVSVLYLLLNLVYVYALPAGELTAMTYEEVEPIAALAAARLFGTGIATPLSIAIGLGLLATLSAYVLIGPRIYYAMARDGLFPALAARLSPKTGTPNNAIVMQSAFALILLFSGTFREIVTYAGVGLSLSSFFVIAAIYVLRVARPEMKRPFKTPGYPVVPFLFLACTAWMVVFSFLQEPLWSGISVGTILAGVPVYCVWRSATGRKTN
ncbi:MAG: amino acid permease [Planctomycetota bacterium]